MMTRRWWLAAAVTMLVAGWVQAAEQDFTLVNKTGVIIHALHVSPSAHDEWGKDILGKDTLASGEAVEIKFHPDTESKLWDLRVEDEHGHAIVWKKLNLLKISKVTLHYDHDSGSATATVE